jgi:hypothetical protein
VGRGYSYIYIYIYIYIYMYMWFCRLINLAEKVIIIVIVMAVISQFTVQNV